MGYIQKDLITNPPIPFTVTSAVAELPQFNLLVSRFVFILEDGKNIRLNYIDRNADVFTDTQEAEDQLKEYFDKTKKDIAKAIKISYQAYSVDAPGPREVSETNDLFWDGTPVQVIVEINDTGGTTSTVTDIAD